jgi:aspartyl/asparaginyl-tRNA synthetase
LLPDRLGEVVYILAHSLSSGLLDTLLGLIGYLFEFTQVDIELKNKTKKDFIELVDGMISGVHTFVIKECSEDLGALDRKLVAPKLPLRVYESQDLKEKLGGQAREKLGFPLRQTAWREIGKTGKILLF